MANRDEGGEQRRRRASKGYEILVPVAIALLALLLAGAIVLVAALALGILPTS